MGEKGAPCFQEADMADWQVWRTGQHSVKNGSGGKTRQLMLHLGRDVADYEQVFG